MTEIFKDISGYEGLYQVSNLGNVKSLNYRNTGCEHLIRQTKDKNGYWHVTLSKKCELTCKTVNHLVGLAFLPNPNQYPEVNHKDENKSNNRVDNLEWCTHQYNTNYGTARKRKREKTRKSIICLKDGILVKQYDAIIDVEKDGYNTGCVSLCLHNKRNTYKGLQWKFI